MPSSVPRRGRRLAEPGAKGKAKAKAPKSADRLVGEAALAAARALVAGGFSSEYDEVRAAVIKAFAGAFARGYGMVPPGTPVATHVMIPPEQFFAFLGAIQALDYEALTPEHFGHVHEHLSGWTVREGKLVRSSEQRRGGVHFTPRELTEPIVRKTLEPLFPFYPPERTLAMRVVDPSVGAGAFLLELVRQLGQRLVDAGVERDLLVAKRLVAVHCAYGVDISPWAVASAKIALWLECRATSMPVGWLDDNIKTGDALVGLDPGQLARFHWKGGDELPELRAVVNRASALGAKVRRARLKGLAAAARHP